MASVIYVLIVLTGHLILGYYKAKAKQAEDKLIDEWMKDEN